MTVNGGTNRVNLATAKAIPFFLLAVIAYVTYTITGPLTTQYLVNPPRNVPARIGTGVAVAIVYYVLLIPVLATYLRLLTVVWRDPGHIPIGSRPKESERGLARGLDEFWKRDVFVCDPQGLPIWCPGCKNWKPDRAHHSQDAGRCTRKMDHFCPWVGGVIGERSYKFFVQFNLYSFLLSAYTMSVLAAFVAKRDEGSNLEVQWLVALGLAGFFTIFTIGIVVNSLWMVLRNVTTIENLDAFSGTMFLAVLLPPELQRSPNGLPLRSAIEPRAVPGRIVNGNVEPPLTSDLDDPSHSSYFSNLQASRTSRQASRLPFQDRIWKGTVTYPIILPTDQPPLPAPPPRRFAILETLPGMNPWDLGSRWRNLQAVFGSSLHEWLLPVKHSPCCDHTSLTSQFPLGPDYDELLVEAGLVPWPSSAQPAPANVLPRGVSGSVAASRKSRRKRRLDAGWQNGERPDGWVSEKAARRQRNEARRAVHA